MMGKIFLNLNGDSMAKHVQLTCIGMCKHDKPVHLRNPREALIPFLPTKKFSQLALKSFDFFLIFTVLKVPVGTFTRAEDTVLC